MSDLDRRVLLSQQKLRSALITLCIEKGYEPLTVREITAHAGVGYATFFRHYKDKEALLLDVLKTITSEVLELIQPSSLPTSALHNGMTVFQHVSKNHQLYRVLFNSGGKDSVLEHVVTLIQEKVLEMSRPRENSLIPPDAAANHVAHATIGLIRWWLGNDMALSPEQMGEIYVELISKPVQAIALEI